MDWRKAINESKKLESMKRSNRNPYWQTDEKTKKEYLMADIITLLVFTTLAFALGLVLIFIGIWHLADSSLVVHYLRYFVEDNLTSTRALDLTFYLPIIWGIFSCLPFALLLGAVFTKSPKQAKRNMQALMAIQLVLLLFELPTVFIPIILLEVETKNVVKAGLHVSMTNNYESLPSGWLNNNKMSRTWDYYMIWQDCCGIDGKSDFLVESSVYAIKWMKTTNTYTLRNGTTLPRSSIVLPTSCCKLSSKTILRLEDWWNIRNYVVDDYCPVTRATINVNTIGCLDSLFASLKTYTMIITIGLSLLCVMQIVSLVVTNITLFCPAKCWCNNIVDDTPVPIPLNNPARRIQEYRPNGGSGYPPMPYHTPNRVAPYESEPEPEAPQVAREWKQTTYSNRMNEVYYSAPDPSGHRRF